MKLPAVRLSGLALSLAVAWSAWGCDHSAPPTAPNAVDVTGTWTGTESDRLGQALLTWTLTQRGSAIFGRALIRPIDATDGTCASCHKSKNGILSGRITGSTITLAMYFAGGGESDPTPACSITLSGQSLHLTPSAITGTYTGSDPCEGTFDGTLAMTRAYVALQSTR
jgi:hypothetical protein